MSTRQASALLLTLGLAVGATQGATVDDLLAAYRSEGAGPFNQAAGERLLSLIHISEPTRQLMSSRMPSSA